ncbi:aminoacetone oxidase family FAD-binding enzyme [uncultured Methanobrevibacter sp.]|uniref:NAD(P)/FAD-dependent oxidoreductase n=1 Tax=uncultured Methanobrevibacter sp. TaxID=253161 RepID=UPI0025E7E393|nr:aminoacetone oxidase family FAD-binding enzyme [uncultured Methanobrevibacter sp.]
MEYDIAIIGGGPAGMMAAIASGKTSNVILLEKNPSLGKKLLLTGGGRCNITNNKPPKKLLTFFDEKNFLKHSFFTFTNEDLYSLFDFDFIEEDNNRIFPESEKSTDVLNGLKKHLKDVEIRCNYEVKKITGKFIINDEIKAKKIIIATGGVTYPQTGCSIDNYFLVDEEKTKIKYGLAPLITKEDLSQIAGITLNNVECIYKKSKVKGDVLISHVGLTGPGIIDLSNKISKDLDYDILSDDYNIACEISIDLLPDLSHADLKSKFDKEFQEKGKTQIKNYLKQLLTNNFIEYFLNKVNIIPDTQLNRINKKEKNRLIENLKRFTFEIIDFNKDLAKITIGGIDLKNINPKTMESKLTPNLYFAGEILDLDGPTGGYNLKIAFSTGYLAGLSAGKNE